MIKLFHQTQDIRQVDSILNQINFNYYLVIHTSSSKTPKFKTPKTPNSRHQNGFKENSNYHTFFSTPIPFSSANDTVRWHYSVIVRHDVKDPMLNIIEWNEYMFGGRLRAKSVHYDGGLEDDGWFSVHFSEGRGTKHKVYRIPSMTITITCKVRGSLPTLPCSDWSFFYPCAVSGEWQRRTLSRCAQAVNF